MTNELTQTFAFEAYDIRIIVENGEPLFCAADVCKALGYGNPSEALRKHCRKDGITKREAIDNLGRKQSTSFINEQNLYRLIMRSQLESAERFQDWVCGEVLPTIRKTGSYGKAQALPSYSEALRQLADSIDKNAALQLENQKLSDKTASLENKIEANKHKVGFYDDCADTTDLYLGTEVASRLNVKRPFFFNYCFNRGIIQRHNKRWMSTAKYRGKKWVFDVIKPFKHPTTGEQKDSDQLYFSMLGMRGIYDMMKEENVSGLNPQPDLFNGATK